MTAAKPRESTNIDKKVGSNLRTVRLSRGLSQTQLGNLLGVSFQQIQKYEKGTNRIGAGRLVEMSEVLFCEVPEFFRGTTDDKERRSHISDDASKAAAIVNKMTRIQQKQAIAILRALATPIQELN